MITYEEDTSNNNSKEKGVVKSFDRNYYYGFIKPVKKSKDV